MEHLIFCPFCGSENVEAMYADGNGYHEYLGEDVDPGVQPFIYCNGCRSEWHTKSATGEEVLCAWNWRA